MFIKDRFVSRKYLMRIFILIMMVLFFILLLLSTVIFLNVQRSVMKNDKAYNKKILSGIQYNIEYMNQTMRQMCFNTYNSQDANYIMWNKDTELYESMMRLSNLQQLVSSTNSLESITIYNAYQDEYISTDLGIRKEDKGLQDLLTKYRNKIPKMQPIPREKQTLGGGNPCWFFHI